MGGSSGGDEGRHSAQDAQSSTKDDRRAPWRRHSCAAYDEDVPYALQTCTYGTAAAPRPARRSERVGRSVRSAWRVLSLFGRSSPYRYRFGVGKLIAKQKALVRASKKEHRSESGERRRHAWTAAVPSANESCLLVTLLCRRCLSEPLCILSPFVCESALETLKKRGIAVAELRPRCLRLLERREVAAPLNTEVKR